MGTAREALSLRLHGGGDPLPTPGPGEGDVTTPFSQSIADTTGTLLRLGTGGFNHLSESLNPFISNLRSLSRAFFLPPSSPLALVAWILERGGNVVRLRLRL
jgi:hypothetical protein